MSAVISDYWRRAPNRYETGHSKHPDMSLILRGGGRCSVLALCRLRDVCDGDDLNNDDVQYAQ